MSDAPLIPSVAVTRLWHVWTRILLTNVLLISCIICLVAGALESTILLFCRWCSQTLTNCRRYPEIDYALCLNLCYALPMPCPYQVLSWRREKLVTRNVCHCDVHSAGVSSFLVLVSARSLNHRKGTGASRDDSWVAFAIKVNNFGLTLWIVLPEV